MRDAKIIVNGVTLRDEQSRAVEIALGMAQIEFNMTKKSDEMVHFINRVSEVEELIRRNRWKCPECGRSIEKGE